MMWQHVTMFVLLFITVKEINVDFHEIVSKIREENTGDGAKGHLIAELKQTN